MFSELISFTARTAPRMKHLWTLNPYFQRYWKKLVLGIVFVVLSNVFRVLQPQAIRDALNKIMAYLNAAPGQMSADTLSRELMKFGLYIFAFALLMGLFMYMMRQTIIVMSRLIEYDLRKDVFKHYLTLDTHFYKMNKTGDLMSRITEDVNKVRMYLGPALLYGINLVSLVFIVIFTMFKVNFTLALYTLLPLPLLSYIIYWVSNKINKRSERIQKQLAKLTTISQESFSGIRMIKSYATEEHWKADLKSNSHEYKDLYLGLSRIDALFFPSMLLLIGLSTLITVYIGGLRVYDGTVTPGHIAEFVIYVNMLTWPVSAIGWCASIIQQAEASQKRINDFLGTQPAITSPVLAQPVPEDMSVEFRNLSFTYPDSGIEAIKNLNLKVPPGTKLAIVGKTASGKSTLGELLLRMYDPTQGAIYIGQKNIKEIPLSELRKLYSYVPQDLFLFSDTIQSNIALGSRKEASELSRHAAELAFINEEILDLPEGYDSVLGERGVNLSGGQKQRLSLARAFAQAGPIVILDDCLSAVDAETEAKILDSIERHLGDRTLILITQRLKQAQYMDQVAVLDHGRLVQFGPFQELVNQPGLFRQLYQIENRS